MTPMPHRVGVLTLQAHPSPLRVHLAQRVGSFVGTVDSVVCSGLPGDEGAERDCEHSRREAERILTQEAEERRLMEERVHVMLNVEQLLNISATSPKRVSPTRVALAVHAPRRGAPPFTLPERQRGLLMVSAAKNRLMPIEEPLTATIQETKEKKNAKRRKPRM